MDLSGSEATNNLTSITTSGNNSVTVETQLTGHISVKPGNKSYTTQGLPVVPKSTYYLRFLLSIVGHASDRLLLLCCEVNKYVNSLVF